MAKSVPPSVPGRPGHKPVVRQEQLLEFRALAAETQRLGQRLKRLREELLQRLEAGADVEPGDLTVEVRHVPIRQLNGPKLIPLLGKDEVEALRLAVEPTVQVMLIVREDGNAKNAHGEKQFGPPQPDDVDEWELQGPQE